MKKTDFFDEDLVTGRGVSDDAPEDADVSPATDAPARSVSDLNIGRMARHKEDVTTDMVGTINEIERLRLRKQELEQDKRYLEELAQKQDEYETGKREMIERLNEGIIALEKKEVQTAQLTDLVIATRNRFKTALEEIAGIDEDQWSDGEFREELYKALVIVDDARMEHNKALAKIEALDGSSDAILDRTELAARYGREADVAEKSFGHWVKVGFAVTLPVIILLTICLAAYLVLGIAGWI